MLDKLVKLYNCNNNVKYSLSELAKIMGITLPEMSNLSHVLIKNEILNTSGNKILFSNIKGKVKETKVEGFTIEFLHLDKFIFDELKEGKILFDRSHKYLSRLDLKLTVKAQKLNNL